MSEHDPRGRIEPRPIKRPEPIQGRAPIRWLPSRHGVGSRSRRDYDPVTGRKRPRKKRGR